METDIEKWRLNMLREDAERPKLVCTGCGGTKEEGTIVCWTCYKYVENPYNEFDGTFEEWLQSQKEHDDAN